MKRTFVLCGLVALVGCGCIRVDQSLTVNDDGSAEFKIAYSLAEQTITQLKAMRKLRDDLRAAAEDTTPLGWQDEFLYRYIDAVQDDIQDDLLQYAAHGLIIERVEVDTRNAWRHVKIEARCKDLAAMAKTPLFREYGFKLAKTEDGNYLMSRDMDTIDPARAPDFTNPEVARTLGPILAGFQVKMAAKVPGRILQANASQSSLYAAEWVFDFGRDSDAFTNFQRQKLRLVFQGRNLELPTLGQ